MTRFGSGNNRYFMSKTISLLFVLFFTIINSNIALTADKINKEDEIAEQIKLQNEEKSKKQEEIKKVKDAKKEYNNNTKQSDKTINKSSKKKNTGFLSELVGSLKKIHHAVEIFAGYSFDINQNKQKDKEEANINGKNQNYNKLQFGLGYKAYYDVNNRISFFTGLLGAGDMKISGNAHKTEIFEYNEDENNDTNTSYDINHVRNGGYWSEAYDPKYTDWEERDNWDNTTVKTTYHYDNNATQIKNDYYAIINQLNEEASRETLNNVSQISTNFLNTIKDKYIESFRENAENSEITREEVMFYNKHIDVDDIIDNNDKKVILTQDLLSDGVSSNVRGLTDVATNEDVASKAYDEDTGKVNDIYRDFSNNSYYQDYVSLITGSKSISSYYRFYRNFKYMTVINGSKDDLDTSGNIINVVPEKGLASGSSTDPYVVYARTTDDDYKNAVQYHNLSLEEAFNAALKNDKVIDDTTNKTIPKIAFLLGYPKKLYDSNFKILDDIENYLKSMYDNTINVLKTKTTDDDEKLFGSEFVKSVYYNPSRIIPDLSYNQIKVENIDSNTEEVYYSLLYSNIASYYNNMFPNLDYSVYDRFTRYFLAYIYGYTPKRFDNLGLIPLEGLNENNIKPHISNLSNWQSKAGLLISNAIKDKASSTYSNQNLYDLALSLTKDQISNLVNTAISEYNADKEEKDKINIHAIKDFGKYEYTDWYEAIDEYKKEMKTRFEAESSDGGSTITTAEQAIIDNTANQEKYAMLKTGLTSAPITDYVNDEQNIDYGVARDQLLTYVTLRTLDIINDVNNSVINEGYGDILDYALDNGKSIRDTTNLIFSARGNRVVFSIKDYGLPLGVVGWDRAIEEYKTKTTERFSLDSSDGGATITEAEQAIIDNKTNQEKYAMLRLGSTYKTDWYVDTATEDDKLINIDTLDTAQQGKSVITIFENERKVWENTYLESTNNLVDRVKSEALSEGYANIFDYVSNSGKTVDEIRTLIENNTSVEDNRIAYAFRDYGFDSKLTSWDEAISEYKILTKYDGNTNNDGDEYATMYAMLKTGLTSAPRDDYDQSEYVDMAKYVLDYSTKAKAQVDINNAVVANIDNQIKDLTKTDGTNYSGSLDYVLNSGASTDDIKNIITSANGYEGVAFTKMNSGIYATSYTTWDDAINEFYNSANVNTVNENISNSLNNVITNTAKEDGTKYSSIFDYVSNSGKTVDDIKQIITDNTSGLGKAFVYNYNKDNAMKAGTNNWTEAVDEFKSLTINDDNENNNSEEYAIMYAMLKTGLLNGTDNNADEMAKNYAMLKTAFIEEPIQYSQDVKDAKFNQSHVYLDQVTEYNQSIIKDIQNEYIHQIKLLNAEKVNSGDTDFFVGTAEKIDYSLIDPSWFENSPVVAINNDINPDDGYLSWDEAIEQYKTEMTNYSKSTASANGSTINAAEQAMINNVDNQKKYAMLKTGLKEKPTQFTNLINNDTIGLKNASLYSEEGQLKYAQADRYVKIYNNNLVSNSISDYVGQHYDNKSILDVVKSGEVNDNDVINILNNVNGVDKVVALRTEDGDNYTNWEEAFNYYKEEAGKDADPNNDTDEYATRYAMLKTGLKVAPTDEELAKDPLNIYEIETHTTNTEDPKENNIALLQKSISTKTIKVDRSKNITKTTTVVETKYFERDSEIEYIYVPAYENRRVYTTTDEKIITTQTVRTENEYMSKEKAHFAVPFGIKIKINDNFSVEPYGLAGLNLAEVYKDSKVTSNTVTERIINNNLVGCNSTGDIITSSSSRKTNLGFTGGAGVNFNFWKDRIFAGVEYRYAYNQIQGADVHSHNVGAKIGYRFNF